MIVRPPKVDCLNRGHGSRLRGLNGQERRKATCRVKAPRSHSGPRFLYSFSPFRRTAQCRFRRWLTYYILFWQPPDIWYSKRRPPLSKSRMDAAATSAPLSPPSLKVSLFAEVNRVSDIGKEETKIFSSMRFDLCGGGDEEVVVGRSFDGQRPQ